MGGKERGPLGDAVRQCHFPCNSKMRAELLVSKPWKKWLNLRSTLNYLSDMKKLWSVLTIKMMSKSLWALIFNPGQAYRHSRL